MVDVIKAKPQKHLLIIEIPLGVQDNYKREIVDSITSAVPELNVLLSTPVNNITLITVDDE